MRNQTASTNLLDFLPSKLRTDECTHTNTHTHTGRVLKKTCKCAHQLALSLLLLLLFLLYSFLLSFLLFTLSQAHRWPLEKGKCLFIGSYSVTWPTVMIPHFGGGFCKCSELRGVGWDRVALWGRGRKRKKLSDASVNAEIMLGLGNTVKSVFVIRKWWWWKSGNVVDGASVSAAVPEDG